MEGRGPGTSHLAFLGSVSGAWRWLRQNKRSICRAPGRPSLRINELSEIPEAGTVVGLCLRGKGRQLTSSNGDCQGASQSLKSNPLPLPWQCLPAPTWAQACYFHSFLVQCLQPGVGNFRPKSSHVTGRQTGLAPTFSLSPFLRSLLGSLPGLESK